MTEMPQSLINGIELTFTAPGHEPLWQKLAERDPEEVAAQARVKWIGRRDFVVPLLGSDYFFSGDERRIIGPPNRLEPDRRVALSLLNYLAGANEAGLSGRLVPEKVLPGGDRFFSGTHALARRPILEAYGRAGADFLEKAASLGAEIVADEADSFSFQLRLLPKVPVQVTLCEDDEEFPAELYYAFDAATAEQIPLGILSALVGLLNDQLAARRL